MDPLNFTEAVEISRILLCQRTFASKACESAYHAFRENMDRALGTLVVPGFASLVSSFWQTATNRAAVEVLGANHGQPKTQEEVDRIGQLSEQYYEQMMAKNAGSQMQAIVKLTHNYETTANRIGDVAYRSLESILKNVVVQSWTAFEVLSGDLWENVLNERPFQLATLSGKKSVKSRSEGLATANESKTAEATQLDKKVLPLAYLERYNYDLSTKMGTILRSEKCNFSKLGGIREAYYLAFSEGYKDVDAVINDNSLDALAAVRHVLVHQAGKADVEFLESVRVLPQLSRFSGLRIDDHILVDGKLLKDLVPAVHDLGRRLVESVADWLNKNPIRQATGTA